MQRRVSSRGVTQVAGQTLRVGFAHRHTPVDIDVHDAEFHVYDQAGEPLATIPEPAAKRSPGPRATVSATEWVRDMSDWDAYYEALAGRQVRELFSRALRLMGPTPPGRALDLGCGDGTETRALLSAGWHVVAVDMEPAAESRILAGVPDEKRARLEVVIAELSTVQLPPAELIYAGASLFFVEPARFPRVWGAIRAALQPGGVLAVNLMGVNDSWASEGCTALRRDEIDQLCDGLDVLELTERDENGTSFAGPKHWHLYDLIARQPLK